MSAPRPPRWPGFGLPLAVAAPAGAVPPQALEAGLEVLAGLAPESTVVAGPELLERAGYLAGADQQRAERSSELLLDPEIGGVLAARGGFGCSRLLPLLDLHALAAAGGCLIGFSDLTCLLNALAGAGLITLHGPVVTQLPRLDEQSRADLAALLGGSPPWPATLQGTALHEGNAQGQLMGGNLTSLCHLLGTQWFPDLSGAILFIEDTGEPPYRLDRLLTQLELAGVWRAVAGVAVGGLSQEAQDPPELTEVVVKRLQNLGKPVITGLPFGHGPANRLLPVGALAQIDGNGGALKVGLNLV